jgi:hypothetical protein
MKNSARRQRAAFKTQIILSRLKWCRNSKRLRGKVNICRVERWRLDGFKQIVKRWSRLCHKIHALTAQNENLQRDCLRKSQSWSTEFSKASYSCGGSNECFREPQGMIFLANTSQGFRKNVNRRMFWLRWDGFWFLSQTEGRHLQALFLIFEDLWRYLQEMGSGRIFCGNAGGHYLQSLITNTNLVAHLSFSRNLLWAHWTTSKPRLHRYHEHVNPGGESGKSEIGCKVFNMMQRHQMLITIHNANLKHGLGTNKVDKWGLCNSSQVSVYQWAVNGIDEMKGIRNNSANLY